MTPSEVRSWLARHGLSAHRARGQNFLVDDRLAAKLVARAGVQPGDSVIEIGTGLGILTRALAARAARVVSIEIDAGLVRGLRAEASLPANVELVHGDALRLDLAALVVRQPAPVRVVANLPYAVAAPLLRRLLALRAVLEDWSVMLQREVAERLAARPGERGYGSLAVIHAWVVDVRPAFDLHPRCFFPVPAVVSRFLRLVPRRPSPLREGELDRLEPWLRLAFSHRRKTLPNALRPPPPELGTPRQDPAAALAALGLSPRLRPEQLDPSAWLEFARRLADPPGEAE